MESTNFHQILKKEKNQNEILESIKLKGKTNKEILSEVSFTHTTLAKHLEELLERREIKFEIQNGEKVYTIGDKGIIRPDDISHLSTFLEKIKKQGGEAHYDYSRLWMETISFSSSWGIVSHLIIDKNLKDQNIFSREDMREIEKLIFEKISKNIRKNKTQNKIEHGDFEIGFSGDFSEILKSIDKDSKVS